MATPNTINLRSADKQTDERLAAAAITPGHLVELTSADKFQKHSTQSGNQDATFALENATLGKTITDDWASGDTVTARTFQRGDQVYAILTTSQTVVIGDLLESAGDGTLQKYAQDSTGVYRLNQIVAKAIEAVTTTGSTSRIKIQIV